MIAGLPLLAVANPGPRLNQLALHHVALGNPGPRLNQLALHHVALGNPGPRLQQLALEDPARFSGKLAPWCLVGSGGA